jgi:hypothetical protein
MPTSPTELVRDWHDFYVLAGTAAATLAGLMFVAASLGASIFSEEHRGPLRAFLTPTVVHFAAVLFACLLVMIPTQSWQTLGVLLGVLGVAGSAYCARIVVELIIRHRFEVDASDRIFYAVVPFLGYLFVVASAVLFLVRVQNQRRSLRRRSVDAASRRGSQRLGHDGLDHDPGADQQGALNR